MGNNFRDTLNEMMKNPEFRAEWEALEPEYMVLKAVLHAREEVGITQKELSEKTGIAQGDISKIENGSANPSIHTLQRIAKGLGKTLQISFM